MIQQFSKILYIFLSSLFALAIIIYLSKWNIFLDTKIFYIVFLLMLPFIDIFIESTKKDLYIWNFSPKYKDNLVKYIWLVLLGIIMYSYDIGTLKIWVTIFLGFSLLFRVDSRVSFFWALSLLIITWLYLIIWDGGTAESMSIFAYYLLIIWVVLEIKHQVFDVKKTTTEKVISSENSNSTYSFLWDMSNLLSSFFQKIKENISQTKNDILEEIWEAKPLTKEKPKSSTPTVSSKKLKGNKQTLYIKLLKYFIKKSKKNIISITLVLFSLNTILALLLLSYSNLATLTFYTFWLLILSYFYSKTLWEKYDLSITKLHSVTTPSRKKLLSKEVTIEDVILNTQDISKEELVNISAARNQENTKVTWKVNKFFINKAVIFASFWLVAWYILTEYFKINGNLALIYVAVFSLFFVAYYFAFSDLDSRLWWKSKKAWKYVWKNIEAFSIKSFLKKHIYMILNLTLILSILAVLWFKTWIFAQWYKDYQEKIGYENWTLSPEALLENEVKEKRALWEQLRPKNNLMSQETQINPHTWEEYLNRQTILQKVPVSDYYTFTQNLALGANNEEVKKLEEIMIKLNYFDSDADNLFEEKTKDALTNLLKTECSWPETTKWILWNQATQCLYTLEIDAQVEIPLWENLQLETSLISNEVQVQPLSSEIVSVIPEVNNQNWSIKKISVREFHTFTQNLALGANNEEVKKLEEIMIKLNYFDSDADNLFEEKSKDALTNLLKTECSWPETTKWILGNRATQCLYTLEIDAQVGITNNNNDNDNNSQ